MAYESDSDNNAFEDDHSSELNEIDDEEPVYYQERKHEYKK